MTLAKYVKLLELHALMNQSCASVICVVYEQHVPQGYWWGRKGEQVAACGICDGVKEGLLLTFMSNVPECKQESGEVPSIHLFLRCCRMHRGIKCVCFETAARYHTCMKRKFIYGTVYHCRFGLSEEQRMDASYRAGSRWLWGVKFLSLRGRWLSDAVADM